MVSTVLLVYCMMRVAYREAAAVGRGSVLEVDGGYGRHGGWNGCSGCCRVVTTCWLGAGRARAGQGELLIAQVIVSMYLVLCIYETG